MVDRAIKKAKCDSDTFMRRHLFSRPRRGTVDGARWAARRRRGISQGLGRLLCLKNDRGLVMINRMGRAVKKGLRSDTLSVLFDRARRRREREREISLSL